MNSSHKKKLNKILNIYTIFGVVLWLFAGVLIMAPLMPNILYRLFPDSTENELASLTGSLEDDATAFEDVADNPSVTPPIDPLPPFDTSLTTKETISIPKIGVNSQIQKGSDWQTALEKGPWIVDDFGTPDLIVPKDVYKAPVIIASHRWGILGWSAAQRKEMSFLNLPDLKKGDRIEIIWNQRKYVYEVYKGEENTEITDYSADLILYTCKLYWESPVRIFRYANRVN